MHRNYIEKITFSVNRTLHRGGVAGAGVDQIRRTDIGRLLDTTTPSTTTQALFRYRDAVLKAARQADSSTVSLAPQQRRKRIKIHGVSPPRNMVGVSGGLRTLREEL